jgi:hypothetical protein
MPRSAPALAGTPWVLLAALVIGAVSAPVRAATITWGTPTAISGDTDVSIAGTLVGAAVLLGPAVTVNGVTFAGFQGVSSGIFSASSPGILPQANTFGSALSPFVNLSTAYKGLLDSGMFTHSPPNQPAPIVLTISGLSVGQVYEFQWWVNDSRDTGDLDRTTVATAGNSVTLEHNIGAAGGVGQFVLGTFTADATTQSISFQGFGAGTNFGSTQINAVQLRAVPEPGGLALAALSLAVLSAGRARTASRSARS